MQRSEIIQSVCERIIRVIDIYNGAFPYQRWDTFHRLGIILLVSCAFFFMAISFFVPSNVPGLVCLLSGCVFNALVITALVEDHLLWDEERIEEQPYRAGLYAASHGGLPISLEPLRHSSQMIESLYDEILRQQPGVEQMERVLIRRCIHRLHLFSLLGEDTVGDTARPITILVDGTGQNCNNFRPMVYPIATR